MEVIIDGVKYAPVVDKQDKHVYKAGDKVRIIANTCCHGQAIGNIVTLEEMGSRHAKEPNRPAWGIVGSDYYISERDLEPYTEQKPEQEYYNGKVVCVESWDESRYFTVGKVYEYENGIVQSNIYDPKGYNPKEPAITKEDALNRRCVKFIEFKG